MKRSLVFIQYIILFFVIYWLATVCEKIVEFDLHRCYEEARTLADYYTVEQFILLRLASTVDFVYFLIHYFAIKASIPQNFVTAVLVFVFYFVAIKIVNKEIRKKAGNVIIFVALFIPPIIYAISVARNLTAFMFFYCAIFMYFKDKKILSLIFLTLGVFTHFTVLMYTPVLILAVVLRNKKLDERVLLFALVGVFLASFIFPNFIKDFLLDAIKGNDLSYDSFADAKVGNFLFNSSINYADKLPVTFGFIYSILLLFWNKTKRGFDYWALFILILLMSFFMNTSFSLVLRCLMFMPIFWWLNVSKIIENSTPNSLSNLRFVSLIGIFTILLHIYGYRQIYLSFI